MAESDPTRFDISEPEWVSEIGRLNAKFGRRPLVVRVLWSFGSLLATGFLPQVNDRTLQILLQPQPQSGLADAVIRISLPEEGNYRRQVSQSGEVVLTMYYPIGNPPEVLDWAEIQIATDPDFLNLANFEVPLQLQ